MKQLDRLKTISILLNELPQTIESLKLHFTELHVKVSSRQLYRDMEDVGQYFLRDGEKLEQRKMEFNRTMWLINKNVNAAQVNSYDIDTFLISNMTIPAGLAIGRKESLLKLRRLLSDHLYHSKVENNANLDRLSLVNTHFYEIPYNQQFQASLDSILWATANHRSLNIVKYNGDSVSLYRSLTFPIVFDPMKIIYHRGSFFVAGMVQSRKQCLVLDVYQIQEYTLSNQTFAFKNNLLFLEDKLKSRFGITQNINDDVYEVLLEFSSITGKYIKMHNWHHSQQFEELPGGNLRLQITCGINRELLGWIFQWMGNVKVLQPEILIDLYNEQLKLINKAKHEPLSYTNISQPE
jgi:hypothetical protein